MNPLTFYNSDNFLHITHICPIMSPFDILDEVKNKQLNSIDFKSDAQDARNSKEWKENREKLLEDSEQCEWCGESNPNEFHIHHTWSRNISRRWMFATDKAFINSEAYNSDLTENRSQCPNCGMKNYYERKTKNPPYRCNNCKSEFDDPELIDGGGAILNENINNKPYTTYDYYKEKANWVDKNKDCVFKIFQEEYEKLLDEYISMKENQTVVICKRCHYLEEQTSKKRCERCGKNWYNPYNYSNDMCWDCIVDKKGLKKCSKCDDKWYNPDKNDYCKNCK